MVAGLSAVESMLARCATVGSLLATEEPFTSIYINASLPSKFLQEVIAIPEGQLGMPPKAEERAMRWCLRVVHRAPPQSPEAF